MEINLDDLCIHSGKKGEVKGCVVYHFKKETGTLLLQLATLSFAAALPCDFLDSCVFLLLCYFVFSNCQIISRDFQDRSVCMCTI